jgi:uncharacterized CHY-type Zn-finger protein
MSQECVVCKEERDDVTTEIFTCKYGELKHYVCDDCLENIMYTEYRRARCPICRAQVENPDMVWELYGILTEAEELQLNK